MLGFPASLLADPLMLGVVVVGTAPDGFFADGMRSVPPLIGRVPLLMGYISRPPLHS
jgi:hypothetical protein